MDGVLLREYIEKIIDEHQKQNDIKFKSAENALKLRSKEMERRLEGLNELRKEVEKDRGQFLKQESYEINKEAIESNLNIFDKRLTAMEMRHDSKSRNMWIALVINFVVAITVLIKELVL